MLVLVLLYCLGFDSPLLHLVGIDRRLVLLDGQGFDSPLLQPVGFD
jgi:hypothetical protein